MSDWAFTWATRAESQLSPQARPRPRCAASAVRSGWAITTPKPRSRSSPVAAWKRRVKPSNGVSTSSQRAARRALGDGHQLGLREHPHQIVPKLASAMEVERDALLRQRRPQLGHPRGELQRFGHEVPAHVRGHNHRAGARGHGGPGELEALAHVARPVVHAGKQVKVDIRCIHGGSTFGPHAPDLVTVR